MQSIRSRRQTDQSKTVFQPLLSKTFYPKKAFRCIDKTDFIRTACQVGNVIMGWGAECDLLMLADEEHIDPKTAQRSSRLDYSLILALISKRT